MRWSKHSHRADLTHHSATALARGDLNGVRTCRIPRPRTRQWKLAPWRFIAIMNQNRGGARSQAEHPCSRPSRGCRRPDLDRGSGGGSPNHVLRDARLRDFETDFFSSAPQRIVDTHPLDQRAQFRVDSWPTTSRSRLPTPVTTKTDTKPPLQGLGSDDPKVIQRWRKPNEE